jgi:hypothetical protein
MGGELRCSGRVSSSTIIAANITVQWWIREDNEIVKADLQYLNVVNNF